MYMVKDNILLGATLASSEHHRSTCQCHNQSSCMNLLSFCLTLPILALFNLIAWLNTTIQQWNQSPTGLDDAVDEEITQDEAYYATRWGYTCQRHTVITVDGYLLTLYRFGLERKPPGEHPVLIGHGLFQCSGAFVLNEKDSMVFSLIDQGYDVWTGNNRAVGSLDHVSLSPNQPCYWHWGLKELALYDFPAMLDYIRLATGQEKVGYIGHSQGNAQAFIALSMKPELADKMSCFIALAPAVMAGSLVTTFPLRFLIQMNRKMFWLLFGKKDFLRVMIMAQRYLPPTLMCTLAYSVFSYLFTWWDHHWVKRRKVKYFQFTPRPVSTKLILDWLEGWGYQGVCLHLDKTVNTIDENSYQKIPLAIVYGMGDYLVDGASFVRSFKGYEDHGLVETEKITPSFSFPSLELVHVESIPAYEHMDTIWGHDSNVTTHPVILRILAAGTWK